jgi:hypothetical protein
MKARRVEIWWGSVVGRCSRFDFFSKWGRPWPLHQSDARILMGVAVGISERVAGVPGRSIHAKQQRLL